MLSYSTNDSGKGKFVDNVRKSCLSAKQIAKKLIVNLKFNLMLLIIQKYVQKINKSQWKTKSNVNIFSDSNIDYKIAQQLGKYKCYGSIILDLSSPISDLSHVETVEDIIDAIILAILQIKKNKSIIHYFYFINGGNGGIRTHAQIVLSNIFPKI